jgi:hypothetical protein
MKAASIDSMEDFGDATANIPIAPDEDENQMLGSNDSHSIQRKMQKVQSQYRINLPKVNKKGI